MAVGLKDKESIYLIGCHMMKQMAEKVPPWIVQSASVQVLQIYKLQPRLHGYAALHSAIKIDVFYLSILCSSKLPDTNLTCGPCTTKRSKEAPLIETNAVESSLDGELRRLTPEGHVRFPRNPCTL